ncbi:MAG: 4Fe-4S dicluster domain-containing protein [Chloroflexota bacterium]
MARNGILVVNDGQLRQTINAFLRELLDKKLVEAVLVPLRHPSGDSVAAALLTDPAQLDKADVMAPLMPVNGARIVSAMTKFGAPGKKIAVVLRPCELRALIELVKLKQASPDNLILIGVDCHGVYPLTRYRQFIADKSSDDFVSASRQQGEDPDLRSGCQICEYPAPLASDLTIGFFGLDPKKALLLEAGTPKGEELLGKLSLGGAASGQVGARAQAVSRLLSDRKSKRQKFFAQAKQDIGGPQKLLALFSACIKCHNCRKACPICYCRECFFESPTFDLEADRYLRTAERKGAIRMPANTLLFQVTRMSHVGASCVGCGCCEEACPQSIPLLKIFQLTADSVQKLFDYTPGRSLDDKLPPAAFKEDELTSIGEK